MVDKQASNKKISLIFIRTYFAFGSTNQEIINLILQWTDCNCFSNVSWVHLIEFCLCFLVANKHPQTERFCCIARNSPTLSPLRLKLLYKISIYFSCGENKKYECNSIDFTLILTITWFLCAYNMHCWFYSLCSPGLLSVIHWHFEMHSLVSLIACMAETNTL